MASLEQIGRDKPESQREGKRGKGRERGKQAENRPTIEMASRKKITGRHRQAWNWQVVKTEDKDRERKHGG